MTVPMELVEASFAALASHKMQQQQQQLTSSVSLETLTNRSRLHRHEQLKRVAQVLMAVYREYYRSAVCGSNYVIGRSQHECSAECDWFTTPLEPSINVCKSSGNLHLCSEVLCDHTVKTIEGYTCMLLGTCYPDEFHHQLFDRQDTGDRYSYDKGSHRRSSDRLTREDAEKDAEEEAAFFDEFVLKGEWDSSKTSALLPDTLSSYDSALDAKKAAAAAVVGMSTTTTTDWLSRSVISSALERFALEQERLETRKSRRTAVVALASSGLAAPLLPANRKRSLGDMKLGARRAAYPNTKTLRDGPSHGLDESSSTTPRRPVGRPKSVKLNRNTFPAAVQARLDSLLQMLLTAFPALAAVSGWEKQARSTIARVWGRIERTESYKRSRGSYTADKHIAVVLCAMRSTGLRFGAGGDPDNSIVIKPDAVLAQHVPDQKSLLRAIDVSQNMKTTAHKRLLEMLSQTGVGTNCNINLYKLETLGTK